MIRALKAKNLTRWRQITSTSSGYFICLLTAKTNDMINLFNGRVVLERRTLVENWRAKVKLPKQGGAFVVIDLQTTDLKTAFVRAHNIYQSLKKGQEYKDLDPPHSSHLTCWDCCHWSVLRVNNGGNGCEFEFPEAKQTAYGKFAAQCHLYDDGTDSSEQDRI